MIAVFARRRLLAACRTGRFDRAPAIDHPLARLMRAFERPPYAIDWDGRDDVVLPFLQAGPWELPTVAIEIDGRSTEAWIDTGGDRLTLPHDRGVEPLATYQATCSAAPRRRLPAASRSRSRCSPPTCPSSAAASTRPRSGSWSTPACATSTPIARLAVGRLERSGLTGMLGVFPPELAGLPIGGLVSHHFLRHWRWTIDFPRKRMLFATH